jgi:hypothetical protein
MDGEHCITLHYQDHTNLLACRMLTGARAVDGSSVKFMRML